MMEPGLDMVGCCNELNAGYAADGYSRGAGIGCVVVTHMVGGLSVLNAIAGMVANQDSNASADANKISAPAALGFVKGVVLVQASSNTASPCMQVHMRSTTLSSVSSASR